MPNEIEARVKRILDSLDYDFTQFTIDDFTR